MPGLSFTRYSGQLAAQLTSLRRSQPAGGAGPNESKTDTGLQRIGILLSNAGDVATVYYDPSAHAIIYDDGLVAISQE